METLEILDPQKAQTVGEMAAADVRRAEVFKRFGIEFCCGGNKSIERACNELNLDKKEVEAALIKATTETKNYSFDFNKWNAGFLIDYIYNEHHQFFYDEYPVISELMEKVVNHHSKNFPELKEANNLFATLLRELISHFAEEENVVFPLIKKLLLAKRNNLIAGDETVEKIDEVLHSMQDDHKGAGELLSKLRQVTNNYTPPATSCNSYKLLYHKLKSLEEDLHQHIHLENNILFPKALKLKQQLVN